MMCFTMRRARAEAFGGSESDTDVRAIALIAATLPATLAATARCEVGPASKVS
jgi:hypothetical protein